MFIKTIIKSLLVFVPNKKVRRHLRKKWYLVANCLDMTEYCDYYTMVKVKRQQLLEQKSKVLTLILGDSHAQLGILPFIFDDDCFNYAFNANSNYENLQSLHFAITNCPNLKQVILPIAYYNGGYTLNQGGYAWKSHILMKKFGYQENFSPKYDFIFYDKLIDKIPDNVKLFACQGYDFDGLKIKDSDPNKLKEKVTHTYHLFKEYHNQWGYLEDICQLCCDHNIHLAIINCPYRNDYNRFLKECLKEDHLDYTDLINPIKNITDKYQIPFFDYGDSDFVDEDFADADHLNFNGALKLTKKIVFELNLNK